MRCGDVVDAWKLLRPDTSAIGGTPSFSRLLRVATQGRGRKKVGMRDRFVFQRGRSLIDVGRPLGYSASDGIRGEVLWQPRLAVTASLLALYLLDCNSG